MRLSPIRHVLTRAARLPVRAGVLLRALPRRRAAVVATSADLCADPAVLAALGARPVLALPWVRGDIVVGWGRRPSGRRAEALAARTGAALVLLEDAPIRAARRGDPAVAVWVDTRGVAFDATRPSEFEATVAAGLGAEEAARVRRLVALWQAEDLSRHAALPPFEGTLPDRYVLIADQVRGDASVRSGLADGAAFARMVEAAFATGLPVVAKAHPDAALQGRAGWLDLPALRRRGATVVDAACHPGRLIRGAETVFAVTSGIGFEALLAAVPVRSFGMPFYAGWGLTEDALPPPERRRPVSLEALIHAAFVTQARWVAPDGTPEPPETALARMGARRRAGAVRGPVDAVGFRPWKRGHLRRLCPDARIRFLPPGAGCGRPTVLAWGDVPVPGAARVVRVEDGMLRSVGLGADLVAPLSWILDGTGLHYDPARPSAIEALVSGGIDAVHLDRARALRARIVAAGATKYNLPGRAWRRTGGRARVVLVAGQVEDDASLRHGAGAVRTNAALAAAARAMEPDAWIVFAPHPDVTAGLRDGGHAPVPGDVDEVAAGVALTDLLDGVDAVHVATSGTGFEALLRGREVICHGAPWYAGWGLTRDRIALPRRGEGTLDALVAAALILAPTYACPATGTILTAEEALETLATLRDTAPARPRRAWRMTRRAWRAATLAPGARAGQP